MELTIGKMKRLILLTAIAVAVQPASGTSAADIPFSDRASLSAHIAAPGAVAVDGGGRLYVAEAGRNRVVVFDSAGVHRKTLTGLGKPISLAVDGAGRLYVGNARRGNVEIYDPELNLLGRLGSGDGEFGQPGGIALDGAGTAYVSDSRRGLIKVYRADGGRQSVIGGPGSGVSFKFPAALAFDAAVGELIVTDLGDSFATRGAYGGARVQVFGADGTLRRSFGHFGRGDGLLVKPLGVAVDGGGRVYVSDAFQNVVQVYDQAGRFLGTLHDDAHPLRTPLGAAFSASAGKLYVCSMTAGRVDAFTVGNTTRSVRLTVSTAASGQGSVSSSPPGIACPGACSAVFPLGTAVTLTAQAAAGYSFAGWSGACVGAGACLVNLVGPDQRVGAHYAAAGPVRKVASDFNGDGLSDVLWVDPRGRQASVWLVDRALRVHASPVASARRQRPAGAADAGGDGKADALWLSDSGNVTLWTMDGALITATDVLGTAGGAAWEIEGFADFDGDGGADILWRNARTGALRLWTLRGGTVGAKLKVGMALGPVWQIAAVADFDGDGRADVLWRDIRTGGLRFWFMGGATVRRTASVRRTVAQGWNVVGSADFTGDRRADLLLRAAADGRFACWPGGAAGFRAAVALGNSPGRTWSYLRSGDYNGDGRDDLLVRDENSGKVKACLAAGAAGLRCALLGSAQGTVQQLGVSEP